MTFGDLRRAALQLAFSYSVDGEEIPSAYNGQADLLAMIPALVNACQDLIATTACRIPASVRLGDLPVRHLAVTDAYTLPEDCFRLRPGLITPEGRVEDDYFVDGYLYTGPGREDRRLAYYRYPAHVTASTADDTVLDNAPEAQAAIPYYVAAHLVLHADAFRYSVLYNEFQTRLANLTEQQTVSRGTTEDVYAGFGANE